MVQIKIHLKFIGWMQISSPAVDIGGMFTREDASRMRQEFWTTFGKYLSPIPSAEGMKINWINYRTGIKGLYFRMETLADRGVISISIEHSDAGIRELFFEQFVELKDMLHQSLEEEWTWQRDTVIDSKPVARIYKELPGVFVTNKDDWPALISFFKPGIVALDAFWENAKWSFEGLK
jgi:hypothetical protein